MPRNSSGSMAPINGPYVGGTTIASAQINARFSDEETELSDSLSRSGKGPMLAPLKNVDGTVAAPAVSFTSEPASGLYKAGAGDVRFAIGGVDFISRNGIVFPVVGATISVSGTNGILFLAGNKNVADAGVDVSAHSLAVRTAGHIFAVQNGDPNVLGSGADRLFVDYRGLLSLAPTAAAAAIQPASLWTAITPNASVTAARGAAFWKDCTGRVLFKGSLVNATGGTAANLVTTTPLPVGFRPAFDRWFPVTGLAGGLNVKVATTGTITLDAAVGNGTEVFLDSISFLAEA